MIISVAKCLIVNPLRACLIAQKINCSRGHGNAPFLVLVLNASQYCTALGGNEFYWNRLGPERELPRTICAENVLVVPLHTPLLLLMDEKNKQAHD